MSLIFLASRSYGLIHDVPSVAVGRALQENEPLSPLSLSLFSLYSVWRIRQSKCKRFLVFFPSLSISVSSLYLSLSRFIPFNSFFHPPSLVSLSLSFISFHSIRR